MSGVNKVILIGNLGKDPEIRYTESKVPVTTLRIATTETYKDRNGERAEQTEWHNVSIWRGLAEVANNYLHKGSKVYIEGRLKTRQWEDKEGNKRYTTDVVATNMVMLDRKQDSAGTPGVSEVSEPEASASEASGEGEGGENLPF